MGQDPKNIGKNWSSITQNEKFNKTKFVLIIVLRKNLKEMSLILPLIFVNITWVYAICIFH